MLMLGDMQYAKVGDSTVIANNEKLHKFKQWFKDSSSCTSEWRRKAREDCGFYTGKDQWSQADKSSLEAKGKPAITVNRIKPLMNVLSGYQRLNRYDIDFLPRTNDDMNLANVRKGVTKYVMDASDYDNEESDVFLDGALTGVGWFEVGYRFDYTTLDGDAFIRRVAPFDIYPDAESRDKYYRDMRYIIRARWVEKSELKNIYPDKADEIEAQNDIYDKEESDTGDRELWYQATTHKVRLCECWYKKSVKKLLFVLRDGSVTEKVEPEMLQAGLVVKRMEVPSEEVRVISFFDNVVLEDMKSPYEHGELPFVPFMAYYLGEDDIPAGVVRDLKDPQREINKRRSQAMHILNTQSNSGWIAEEGALSPEQESNLKNSASTPGALIKVGSGSLTGGRMQRIEPQQAPMNVMQASQEAGAELTQISGINEALMGTDISNTASGRAIELKQKQAITHIATLFDNLRYAKKRIVFLLWGKRNAKGVIPQYYTDQKTYRIVGIGGKPDFITVNQQQSAVDPQTMQIVQTTLNDLSQGEFDIVIADTPATATQRTTQFYTLVDASSKLGIPGDLIFDILLDLSDVAQKEEIKKRYLERQQSSAKAAQEQQQAEIEAMRQYKLSKSMAFKDLPVEMQLQMAAQAGMFPKDVADQFMQFMIQQYARQMGMAVGAPAQITQPAEGQLSLQQMQEALQGQGLPSRQGQQAGSNPQTLTDAAARSLMAGAAPAL
jgi:hypothetical protein